MSDDADDATARASEQPDGLIARYPHGLIADHLLANADYCNVSGV